MEKKPPNIPESTMREIAEFFHKTSIPRIIAALKEGKIEISDGQLERVENKNESNNRDNPKR